MTLKIWLATAAATATTTAATITAAATATTTAATITAAASIFLSKYETMEFDVADCELYVS